MSPAVRTTHCLRGRAVTASTSTPTAVPAIGVMLTVVISAIPASTTIHARVLGFMTRYDWLTRSATPSSTITNR